MSLFSLQSRIVLPLAAALAVLAIASCKLRSTYAVPEGKHLLKKNKLEVKGDNMDKSSMEKVIRQQPNLSTLGVKSRLIVYNMVDSAKVEKTRMKKAAKLRRKNDKRRQREIRVNTRRRDRAIRRGKETYFYRTIELKDTLSPKISLRERMKYRFGEAPVIVDTFLFEKSKEQLSIYLHKKGYFYDTVTGYLDTVRRKKIVAHFKVITGPRYYIDSVYLITDNSSVRSSYVNYIRKEQGDSPLNEPFYKHLVKGESLNVPFDQDVLADYKNRIAQYMRNDAYYGFSPTHVKFRADTNKTTMKVKLGIEFTDRFIRSEENPDEVVAKRHAPTYVEEVYFHIADTSMYLGNFRATMDDLQLEMKKDNFLQTIDTLVYDDLMKKVSLPDSLKKKYKQTYYKSTVERNIFGQPKDSIAQDKFRIATFLFNGKAVQRHGRDTLIMFVKPGLIEAQNYLENENYYKEYYLDRSYNRLQQLGIFAIIKPVIEEIPGNKIIVHYYLVPAKKQSYSFEPRFTNSNGFLGVSASVNYTNKNLFRSGWNTTVSMSGGFESQPPVFATTLDGAQIQQTGRSFNTFEFGPTLKFDLPGLFPVNVAKLDKRQRPRTILSAAYNFQQRPDFSRSVFQLNYLWKFYVGKTQIFSVGLPGASVIKFVALKKTPEFETRINALNDLFLRNAYSDQFIWEDLKFAFDYDNINADDKKPRLRVTSNTTINIAGNLLYYGFRKLQAQDSMGHYQLFGVPYSQFALIDFKLTSYYDVNRRHTLAGRIMLGIGSPYKNTVTSLPYDYSFYAGGANDNRGWVARSLGPGSYKYYLDTLRTATQIGDVRFGGSLEYRLAKGKLIQSAVFLDVGNIWTIKDDPNRQGGKLSKNVPRELGLAVGYGIRLDFSFFIFRLDAGLPLTNPALPDGSRWIFQSRDAYNLEIANSGMSAEQIKKIPPPFGLHFHIGIGLPF